MGGSAVDVPCNCQGSFPCWYGIRCGVSMDVPIDLAHCICNKVHCSCPKISDIKRIKPREGKRISYLPPPPKKKKLEQIQQLTWPYVRTIIAFAGHSPGSHIMYHKNGSQFYDHHITLYHHHNQNSDIDHQYILVSVYQLLCLFRNALVLDVLPYWPVRAHIKFPRSCASPPQISSKVRLGYLKLIYISLTSFPGLLQQLLPLILETGRRPGNDVSWERGCVCTETWHCWQHAIEPQLNNQSTSARFRL